MENIDSLKNIIRFFDDVAALVDDIFDAEVSTILDNTLFDPPTDLFETESKIHLIMEIAGVKREDLSIAVGPTMLLIQGIRRPPELIQQGTSFYKLEIPYGGFKKKIYLPSRIKPKSVKVDLQDGLLTMEFSKDKKSYRIIKIE